MPVRERLNTFSTPGQRWSAAVILVLAVALAFAQPDGRGGGSASFAAPQPSGVSTLEVPAVDGAPDLAAVALPAVPGLPSMVAPEEIPPPPPDDAGGGDAGSPGGDDGAAVPVECTADAGLPMPFFALVLAQLQMVEATAADTAGQALPASVSAPLAIAAGCS